MPFSLPIKVSPLKTAGEQRKLPTLLSLLSVRCGALYEKISLPDFARNGRNYRDSRSTVSMMALARALMAERGTWRYVGKRVQEHAGLAPKGMKRPATQWVKPGLIGRVKHLRGEEDLRHASLQDFREEKG
ncbi:hypothetical protein NKI48_25195 [Mesorhizobium sp. M0644]|uniref:hypothetical protein n=2 Tax=Mesorhizobium TaxID=68287 RepID=UPI0033374682